MNLIFSSLLVLISLSMSSALFWAGNMKHNSVQLLKRTETWNFSRNKCRYIHFNTCREYNAIMDRILIKTLSGENLLGNLKFGGEEDFYAVIELCGVGTATYETTIFGHFRNQPIQQFVNVDDAYLVFDQFWPCKNPVKMY